MNWTNYRQEMVNLEKWAKNQRKKAELKILLEKMRSSNDNICN